jgi:protein-S-isoprenylcysteine O-methyltransferase Ste14
LIAAGTGVLLGTLGALLPPPIFVWVLDVGYVRPEERLLAELFGDEYAKYRSAVRRWL